MGCLAAPRTTLGDSDHERVSLSSNTEDHHDCDGHGHSHGDAHTHSSGYIRASSDESDNSMSSLTSVAPGHNINVTAAFIHVLGDAVQTIGVMIAAGLIWYNPSWNIADPICTFLFSVLVLFTTTRLLKQTIGVLMEGILVAPLTISQSAFLISMIVSPTSSIDAPDGINVAKVEASLGRVNGVLAVHDLHIWQLTVNKNALSVHLVAEVQHMFPPPPHPRYHDTHSFAADNSLVIQRCWKKLNECWQMTISYIIVLFK
jgi:Co/Zn/Cd efflux system component